MDNLGTPSPAQTRPAKTRSEMTLQVRTLKRELRERTESRFHGNPLGVDVQATDLALRSSQLVLKATSMRNIVTRAAKRRGLDAKKLMRVSA